MILTKRKMITYTSIVVLVHIAYFEGLLAKCEII